MGDGFGRKAAGADPSGWIDALAAPGTGALVRGGMPVPDDMAESGGAEVIDTAADPVRRVLEGLGDSVRSAGAGWSARCPAHEDRRASLSVRRGDDGRALLTCHAGCAVREIAAKLGLQMRDLFPPKVNGHARTNENGHRRIVATYDYTDAAGKILYQCVRYEPKDFSQRRPDRNGGWIWKLADTKRVLYRLPDLLAVAIERPEDWVFIVEGEKDADRLRSLGLIATTSVGGASKNPNRPKWRDEYSPALRGLRVAIIPDADIPGRAHAEAVARSVSPHAAEVRVVELPEVPSKGDVSDYLNAGGSAVSLLELVEAAPIWKRTGEAPPKAPLAPDEPEGLALTHFSEVQPMEVEWLWSQRFALGKVSLLCGDPGLGKSFLTIYMAAVVSTGGMWTDGGERIPRGKVMLLNAEDDPADTIRPRLDAAGADPAFVFMLNGIRRPLENGKSVVQGFTLAELPMLAEALAQEPDCRLIIIDPVSAFLAKSDSHKDADIRGLLAPLAELASKHRVAIVLVTHFNKSGGGRALYKVMGSLAFVAAARAAWLVTADKANPKRRLFLPMKNNLGNDSSGLAYSIIGEGQQARVVWERGPIDTKADDAISADAEERRGPEPARRNAAEEWLRELLESGPMESAKVKESASAAGLAWPTVRRAQESIGIRPFKAQFGGAWTWKLPPPKSTCSPSESTCSSDDLT
jgi:hypothetical protein